MKTCIDIKIELFLPVLMSVNGAGHVTSSVNDDVLFVVFSCEWDTPQFIVVILYYSHYFMSLVEYYEFFFGEYDLASCTAEFAD